MRFSIKIDNHNSNKEPILMVDLYTKTDEEHEKDDYDTGVYWTTATISEDKMTFLSMVEQCVNSCLEAHQAYLEISEEINKDIE
jgi:hypothetical protein